MSHRAKKLRSTFSRLPEPNRDSHVRLAYPGAVTLRDFLKLAPLIDHLMGQECDGFAVVRGDDHSAAYVSRGYARLVGGEGMELEGTPCYYMLNRDAPCGGCLGPETLKHPDGGTESASMHFRFARNPGVYDARFVPLHLKDGGVFLKAVTHSDEARIEAMSRMASIGEIAASAMHDFNNYISGVTGYLQIMIRDMESGRHLAALDAARELAGQADGVMKFCSNISNAASGRRTPIPADVESGVSDIVRIARKSLEKSDKNGMIEITCEVRPGDLQALAVPGDIQRAMLNIIMNAIDHGYGEGERGKITVRARASEGMAVIEVENDGRMIPYDIREALLSRPISSPHVKHGFGLYYAAKSIRQFGGDITYESEPGKTVFRIILPKSVESPGGNGHGGNDAA